MTTLAPPRYRPGARVPLAGSVAAIAASLANAVIAFGATSAGAQEVDGLTPGAFIAFTVIAGFTGALGWHLINRRARRPAHVMGWLVPVFVLVSFVPDLMLVPSMGWLFAGTLMLMHLATATIAVTTYRRALPLRAST